METIKYILEKLLKAIIIASILMGTTSAILLFRFHLYHYPIIVDIHSQELMLLFCMIGSFILSIRFRVKYLKWIGLIGIILSIINLIGWNILLDIDIKRSIVENLAYL